MLKVALVGCGKIADGHIEEIKKLPSARLVGVCDRELLMAEQTAFRFGIGRFYEDLDRMLDEQRPDVLHVTTPPESHLPLATKALGAGCHVFVEKPLGMSLPQTEALINLATTCKKKITAGLITHFDPVALQLQDLLVGNVIGDPVHVESFYGYDLSGAYGRSLLSDPEHWVHRLPGKLLHNLIDHVFIKLASFIKDETPQVSAVGSRTASPVLRFHDELRVLVKGTSVTGYGTFSCRIQPASHFVRVYGTKNSVTADFTSRVITFAAKPQLPSALGRVLMPFGDVGRQFRAGIDNVRRFMRSEFHFFAGLNELIRRFYVSVEQDGPPPIAYTDLRRLASIVDTIFLQLEC